MNWKKLIPVILFITALILATVYLNEGLFHYDAIVLAQAVEKTYETKMLQPAINGRYGSVILSSLFYLPFWLFGKNADLAVRLTSAFFYALSIASFYVFLSEYMNSKLIATYASILFLTAPIYLSPNTYGKEHGMALAFFFLSLIFIVHSKQKNWFYTASAISLIISLSIREAILALIPIYLIILWQQEKSFKTKFLYCFLPFCILFLIMTYSYFSFIITKTLFPTQVGTAYFHFSFKLIKKAFKAIWMTTPILTICAALLGILIGLNNSKIILKIKLFTFWLIYTFFVYSNNSTFTPRYLDTTISALCVFAGIGISTIHKKQKYLGVVLGIGLAVWGFLLIEPVLAYRHQYNGPMHFGKYIENITNNNDIIIAQDDSAFITYYGNRTSIGLPIGNINETKKFIAEIQEKIKNKTDVYLTQTAFVYDPGEINQKIIPQSFKVAKRFVVETEASHLADIEFYKYKHVISKLKLRNETV